MALALAPSGVPSEWSSELDKSDLIAARRPKLASFIHLATTHTHTHKELETYKQINSLINLLLLFQNYHSRQNKKERESCTKHTSTRILDGERDEKRE